MPRDGEVGRGPEKMAHEKGTARDGLVPRVAEAWVDLGAAIDGEAPAGGRPCREESWRRCGRGESRAIDDGVPSREMEALKEKQDRLGSGGRGPKQAKSKPNAVGAR